MNITDSAFNNQDGVSQYRSWVFPDLYDGKPAVLSNWHPEDLEAFCGGEYVRLPAGSVRGVAGAAGAVG